MTPDRWHVEVDDNGDAEVTPVDDLIGHEPDHCICGPAVRPATGPNGASCWVTIHYALDNRP